VIAYTYTMLIVNYINLHGLLSNGGIRSHPLSPMAAPRPMEKNAFDEKALIAWYIVIALLYYTFGYLEGRFW